MINHYMTYVARATLIIPIMVMVIGVALYLTKNIEKTRVKGVESTISKTVPTQIPAKAKASGIDLKGPTTCSFTSPDITASMKIKDNSILVNVTQKKDTSQYLLNGDCLYLWENTSAGNKVCGVGQYLAIFHTLSSAGLVDISTVFSSLETYGLKKEGLPSVEVISGLMESCKAGEVAQDTFAVPSNIIFTDVKK